MLKSVIHAQTHTGCDNNLGGQGASLSWKPTFFHRGAWSQTSVTWGTQTFHGDKLARITFLLSLSLSLSLSQLKTRHNFREVSNLWSPDG